MTALAAAFTAFGNAEHGRLIHYGHFERVKAYLDQGGGIDESELTIEPTILTDIDPGAAAMQEEIFGPVLPVIACATLNETLQQVKARPAPLAVYAFSEDREVLERIARETVSGGVCFNDTVVQITSPSLPFGGVGASGMGRYWSRRLRDLNS